MAGAADALQAAGDRLRALDLDHEVDGAHVDAELEAGGGDEARNPPRFQILLDDHPLLARQRAVVRPRDLFLGQLVQPHREPLGQPPVVDEDDRRAVLLDELEDRRVDRRPDRAGVRLVAGVHLDAVLHHRLGELVRRPELAQVLDRHDHLEIEVLARAGVDELDRAIAGDEAADLLERALRRREADPLRRLVEQRVEALERESKVGAALGARDGVHLVDDHRVDRAQRLARLRGQHQEERLGRRDQDVRRLLHQLAPLFLRRVAGADADAEVGLDPGERPAEVALHVVVERLQRRDVEEAQALAGRRIEPVDAVEKRGKRLAGAGRSLDQHVVSGRDRGPTRGLRRGRSGKRTLEPGPRLHRKRSKRVHVSRLPRR